ncbi:MAG: S26 family signal peptidase [Rhizobiaceae bacterium]
MNEQSITRQCACSSVVLTTFGVLLIGVSAANNLPKQLIWNASASLPTGLYVIQIRSPQRGELVVAKLPDWVRLVADQRGYLLGNVPALKRVAALAGDRVCRADRTILVNGKPVVWARKTDRYGRDLPVWSGCETLDEEQIFLLADHPKSFDGRYFGVTKLANVLGVASPVWTGSE